MEFIKLLEERRSIRAFDPEKHVTAEQIQEIEIGRASCRERV